MFFILKNLINLDCFNRNDGHNHYNRFLMKLNATLLYILLFTSYGFSQNNKQSKNYIDVLKTVFNDFQQEKFFLHTNKTTYFSGEKIWWKGYIVSDFNDKAIPNTTNLYVNFYDCDKTLISHQLFYCNDGTAFGEISLPETLKTGRYYINLDTKWNKNFQTKYVVPIDIINTKTKREDYSEYNNQLGQQNNEDVELKFYPESGNLLDGIVNTVFYTTKNGKAFIPNAKGYIINESNGDTISKFQSNRNGYGVFKLLYKTNDSYNAKLYYSNENHVFRLDSKKDSRIIIQKKKKMNGAQKFSIKISEAFAKGYHKKELFATIHRNGKLLYVVPIKINKSYRNYGLNVLEENLFNGINTISLFNDSNKIIVERQFLNLKENQINFEVFQSKKTKDSILLDFRSKDILVSNLSVSVLPHESKLNTNSSNILSAFLTAPYVSSTANANLFFNDTLTDFEKDMLLQTQEPDETNIQLLSYNSKPIFDLENGLNIKGKVETPLSNLKGYNVLLSSTENAIILTTHIKSNKTFEFEKLNLKKKSNYKLALLDPKGELVNARFYIYKNTSYKVDSLLTYSEQANKILNKQTEVSLNPVDNDIFINKSAERLDEVLLFGKKKKKESTEKTYPNNPKELGNGFSRNIPINENDNMNYSVIEFLNNQPGVLAIEDGISARVTIQRSAFNSLTGDNQALIIYNGMQTTADVLIGMRLFDIKSIKVNAIGAGYGLRGGSGVVIIDVKRGKEDYSTAPNEKYFLSEIDFGFSFSTSEYEASNLIFNSTSSRSYYETLDWIPNVDLKPNSSNTIMVFKGKHKMIKLFINGMNTNGQLVYKVVNVSLE